VTLVPGLINTREVVLEKVPPFLEPGEVVAHVVKAVEGRHGGSPCSPSSSASGSAS
jgi:hypothetical protein